LKAVNTFLCFQYWVWSKNGGIYFHAFRRALSIEMMDENIYNEDDGIEDSNNEPRRSPRQTTVNNHKLTMAPLHCTQWNIKDGWVENCKNPYQASSRSLYVLKSKYITGTDRRSTVLKLGAGL
jgi:hypothetical protein